jgi:hypothetical protein
VAVESSFFNEGTGLSYGLGYAALDRPADDALNALVLRLRAEGWSVETWKIYSAAPSIPPQPLILCEVAATREDPSQRSLNYDFQLSPDLQKAAIRWNEGPQRFKPTHSPGPC